MKHSLSYVIQITWGKNSKSIWMWMKNYVQNNAEDYFSWTKRKPFPTHKEKKVDIPTAELFFLCNVRPLYLTPYLSQCYHVVCQINRQLDILNVKRNCLYVSLEELFMGNIATNSHSVGYNGACPKTSGLIWLPSLPFNGQIHHKIVFVKIEWHAVIAHH